jgi:type II secretory pathway pseudopilin PulG
MIPWRANRQSEGFTLVEVLVAFTILAAAIVMLFEVYSDGFRRLQLAREERSMTADGRALVAVIAHDNSLQAGKFKRRGTDGRTWTIEAKPLATETADWSELRPIRLRLWPEAEQVKPEAALIDTIIISRVNGQ